MLSEFNSEKKTGKIGLLVTKFCHLALGYLVIMPHRILCLYLTTALNARLHNTEHSGVTRDTTVKYFNEINNEAQINVMRCSSNKQQRQQYNRF